MDPVLGLIITISIIFFIACIWYFGFTDAGKESVRKQAELQQQEIQKKKDQDSRIVCPQCQMKGYVSTRQVDKKTGISGTKATAALMTGGLSLFATGLSKKDKFTEAKCSNCGSAWYF